MRRSHFLQGNKSTPQPSNCIWFDTETKQERVNNDTVLHHLWFGYGAYRRRLENGTWGQPKFHRFRCISGFWYWVNSLSREKTRLYLFCHNTNFDVPVLDALNEMARWGWTLQGAVIQAPPTILKWRKGKRTIILLDTLNIWRMPLDQLGQSIGLDKLPMPSNDASQDEWDTYGKRDVEVIMEACILWWRFLKENDLGGVAPTLASQAMRAYRHRFMPTHILCDDNEKALEVSRACYHGGRTECFHIGRIINQTYLVDVNSMYPFVMHNEYYPTILKAYRKHVSLNDLKNWLLEWCVCAKVILETTENCYATFANKKLMFPVGCFEAHLTTPDLKYAQSKGHIVKVIEAAVFDKAKLFTDFISYFYNERLKARYEKRDIDAFQFKILMNSLYGKFGQRGIVWEEHQRTDDLSCQNWIEINADTGEVTKYRQLGGLVQVQTNEQESRDSHPAIAAHVTAYARRYLYDLILRAGMGNVYYADTDSMLVNAQGLNNLKSLMHDTILGGLKLEGTYNDVEIFGAKDYRFGNKERHKGVKKTARWKGKNTVETERWSSLKGLINSGKLSKPTTTTFTKRLSRIYDKGRVLPSGDVVPFVIGPDVD